MTVVSRRLIPFVVVLAIFATLAVWMTVPAPSVASAAHHARAQASRSSFAAHAGSPSRAQSSAMPAGLYPSVIAAEERTASKAFDVTRSGAIFSARNPSYHMSLGFTRLGVTVGQMHRPASQIVRLGPATLLAHGPLMDTGSAIPVAEADRCPIPLEIYESDTSTARPVSSKSLHSRTDPRAESRWRLRS